MKWGFNIIGYKTSPCPKKDADEFRQHIPSCRDDPCSDCKGYGAVRQYILLRKDDDKVDWLDWADKQSRKPLSILNGRVIPRRVEVRWRKKGEEKNEPN